MQRRAAGGGLKGGSILELCLFVYLFILRGRKRVREHEGRGEQRENPKRAPCCQQELDVGLELMTLELMTQAEPN